MYYNIETVAYTENFRKKIVLITFFKVVVYDTSRREILCLYIFKLWQAFKKTIALKLYVQH